MTWDFFNKEGIATSRLEAIVNAIAEKGNLSAEITKDGPFTAWVQDGKLLVSKSRIDTLLKHSKNKSVKGLVYTEAGKGLLSNLGVTYAVNKGKLDIKGKVENDQQKYLLAHIYNHLEGIRVEESLSEMYDGVKSELEDYAKTVGVSSHKELEAEQDGGQIMSATHLVSRYPELAKEIPKDILDLANKLLPYADKCKNLTKSEEVLDVSLEVYELLKQMAQNPPPQIKKDSYGNIAYDGNVDLREYLQAERAKAATQGKDAPGLGVEVSKGKSSKDFTKTFNECLKSSITDFCDSYNIVIPKELKLPVGGDNIYQIPTDAKSKDIEDVPPKEYNDIALYYSHKGKVNGFVSTLAKKIKDAFILKNKSRFLGGYTTGKKLDGSTLTRILRDDDRLFLQKEKEDKPSVCITLLLDLSGSMGHKTQEKIRLLSKSTIIFSEVLTKLKVPFEILAFTTAGGGGSVDDSVRSDYLYHMKIKEYDEAYSNDVKARIGGLTGHNNNLDAEALLWAYRRVKARPERDKFILVLSDGQPSGHVNETLHHNFLISLVKNITKKGITVIGIGYLHKGVERFYKNNLVIKDVQELPGAFLRLLKRCILKEKTKA